MNKIKAVLFLGVLSIMFTVSNSAMADWTQISDNDNDTLYIDMSTIDKTGNTVKMSDVLNLKKNTGDNYLSLKSLQEYDCKESKTRVISFSTYSAAMAKGNLVKSNGRVHDWLPVKAGGLNEIMWKAACGKS